jgi:hypothetical protein
VQTDRIQQTKNIIYQKTELFVSTRAGKYVPGVILFKVFLRAADISSLHFFQEISLQSFTMFPALRPLLFFCLAYSSILKMEALRSSEISVDFCRNTWPYVSEDCTLPSKEYSGSWLSERLSACVRLATWSQSEDLVCSSSGSLVFVVRSPCM